MSKTDVYVKVLDEGEMIKYATPNSAGLDLKATKTILIDAYHTVAIPTGIGIEIPEGYLGMVCSRSGLASRNVIVTNSPGIIDSDYRGEIRVLLTNLSSVPYQVKKGDRVAQLVIVQYLRVQPMQVDTLSDTARGDGGFGSTGR